jgi:hypothetical protein
MPKNIGNGLSVEKVIVCEDVRMEIGNKHTILGAIAGDFSIPQFPAAFKLAAYIDMTAPAITETIEVRWMFSGHQQISALHQFTGDPPNHVVIVLPPVVLMASNAGDLALEIRVQNGNWVELEKRRVH